MRFGAAHKGVTTLLAASGAIAMLSTPMGSTFARACFALAFFLSAVVSNYVERSRVRRALRWGGPAVLVVVEAALFIGGQPPLETLLQFSAYLLVFRLATRDGAVHDHQIALLSLLALVMATLCGGGLPYALSVLSLLAVGPAALILSHLRREVESNYRQGARDRTGSPVDVPRILKSRRVVSAPFLLATTAFAVPSLVFMAVVFVVFPRVRLTAVDWQNLHHPCSVGFADRVDLGAEGPLTDDDTVAFRVTTPGATHGHLSLYFQGTSLDFYDGRAWSRRVVEPVTLSTTPLVELRRPPDRGRDVVIGIDPEAARFPVLFLPPGAVALELYPAPGESAAPAVETTRTEVRYLNPFAQTGRYDVYLGTVPGVPPHLTDTLPYLQLPNELSPRVSALASEWTAGIAENTERATAIEYHLRSEYTYDLDTPSRGSQDPLSDFLFVSKRGHCEFFSTAMAVMLRTLSVPSRDVTGFAGGSYNRFGRFYTVRKSNAHSWVEAYVMGPQGLEWKAFDPTPRSTGVEGPMSRFASTFRDWVDAMGRHFNHYVQGFTLSTQSALCSRLVSSLAWWPAARRFVFFAALGLLLVLGARVVRRYRHLRSNRPRGDGNETRPHDPRYRELALYLATQKLERPNHEPPFAFAMGLIKSGHPAARKALELTRLYNSRRFRDPAGRDLTRDARERAQDGD